MVIFHYRKENYRAVDLCTEKPWLSWVDIELQKIHHGALMAGLEELQRVSTFHAVKLDAVTGHQHMADLLSKLYCRNIGLEGLEFDEAFAGLQSPNLQIAFGIPRGQEFIVPADGECRDGARVHHKGLLR